MFDRSGSVGGAWFIHFAHREVTDHVADDSGNLSEVQKQAVAGPCDLCSMTSKPADRNNRAMKCEILDGV